VGAAGGTTLGGNGSITGDVTLAPGAILAPGGSPGAVGTLTVGSLTLSPGSVLEYDLGRYCRKWRE
jgi:fibronectin-binding autotransporter adhesin